MHIEIKQNQIVVQFSEKESKYIAEKAGHNKIEEISNYIKVKIIKALGLEELENATLLSLGGDFNFDKIKNVSAELKKRKDKAVKSNTDNEPVAVKKDAPDNSRLLVENEDSLRNEGKQNNRQEQTADLVEANALINDENEEPSINIDIEVGDEMLADLLDKDLLKKRQKPNTGGKKAN